MDDMSEPKGVELIGPFIAKHQATVNGYAVPLVEFVEVEGGYNLSLDHRFTLPSPATMEELDRWLPILAHAMAIAAGYSSHGEHSKRTNPYSVRVASFGDAMPTQGSA